MKLGMSLLAVFVSGAVFAAAGNFTSVSMATDLPGCSIGAVHNQYCGTDSNGDDRTFNDPGCSVTCNAGQKPTCTNASCNGVYAFHNSTCTCQ